MRKVTVPWHWVVFPVLMTKTVRLLACTPMRLARAPWLSVIMHRQACLLTQQWRILATILHLCNWKTAARKPVEELVASPSVPMPMRSVTVRCLSAVRPVRMTRTARRSVCMRTPMAREPWRSDTMRLPVRKSRLLKVKSTVSRTGHIPS